MKKKIVFSVVIVLAFAATTLAYVMYSTSALPSNRPSIVLERQQTNPSEKTLVVCIGDSITHGQVSYNYVDELSARYKDSDFEFVNAGINGELAYNVLQRFDPIIQLDPAYVTILIGTNDVLASMNPTSAAEYMERNQLPQTPSLSWYKNNLTLMIELLQQQTSAQIALISLPPVSENTSSPSFERAATYSRIIEKLASDKNLTYLPLNETMRDVLSARPDSPMTEPTEHSKSMMLSSIVDHYLLRKTWDEIANENQLVYLTDNVHLNRKGGMVVADLIESFLPKQ